MVENQALIRSKWKFYVFSLIFSMFFASLSSIYTPLLANYVEELGGPAYLATASILTIPQISAGFAMILISLYADKTGKRIETLLVILLSGVLAHLLLLVPSLPTLIVSRALAGITLFSAMPVATSIINMLAPRDKLGSALAFYIGATMIASSVTQIFSGFLYAIMGGYTFLIYTALVFNTIALIIAFIAGFKIKRYTNVRTNSVGFVRILGILRIKHLVFLTLGHSLYSVGWNLVIPTSPFIMSRVFNASPQIYTVIFGLSMLTMGIGQYIWGPAIDKWGGIKIILSFYAISALVTLTIAIFELNYYTYSILLILFALFASAGPPSVNYIVSRSVNPEITSIAVSIPWFFAYLASTVGFSAGPLTVAYGMKLVYQIAALMQFTGVILLSRMHRTL
ncbi:MAG: MFS transporter [Desulfurococcaceae archaeon]